MHSLKVPNLYLNTILSVSIWASLGAQWLKKKPACQLQETRVQSLGGEDSPGEGNGNPLPYSCLRNPMDRGAWRATVHRVTKEADTTEPLNTECQWVGAWTLLRYFCAWLGLSPSACLPTLAQGTCVGSDSDIPAGGTLAPTRSPEKGRLSQYSCLENPRDRGACWAAVYGAAQSRTRLKWLSSSSSSQIKGIQASFLLPVVFWKARKHPEQVLWG